MKKVKEIDRQVRKQTKEILKDQKPDTGVVFCIVDGWSWVPKPTSKSPMTISCVNESIHCCPTDMEYNPNFTNMAAPSKSIRFDQK